MVKPKNDHPKITVESLLRLKRHEMPDDAFWAGFDRKLEKRIVQSIVQEPTYRVGWFQPLRWARHPASVTVMTVFGFCAMALFYLSPEPATIDEQTARLSQDHALIANPESPNQTPAGTTDMDFLLVEAAEKNFVIDVWTANQSDPAVDQTFHLTHSSGQNAQAYYVADQLNSQGGGWSGERLPF